jgi:hypothetical protein
MTEQPTETTKPDSSPEFGQPLVDPERGLVATDSTEQLPPATPTPEQPAVAEGDSNA